MRALPMLLALLAAGCGRNTAPLAHEMYLWQLAWTPAVSQALATTAPSMARVHVLALEIHAGGLRHPSLDVEALRAAGRPLVAVVRIDGRVADLPPTVEHIRALLGDWQRQQLPMQALEIDFDCATSQLPRYASFLAGLRPLLPAHARLVITALPDWMSSPHLPELARVVDEVVLQVHSVSSPTQGLFNPEQAREWIERYAQLTTARFLVALPTYGSAVRWDEDGRVVAITSETPGRAGSGITRELAVEPDTMAAFVRQLERDPVRGLAGIAWFRMPTGDDERAWSVATFLAVVRAEPLQHAVVARIEPRGAGGDIVIENTGMLDAPVPRVVTLAASCREADAVNGYALQRHAGILRWVSTSARMMRAGAEVSIGWANCDITGARVEISH